MSDFSGVGDEAQAWLNQHDELPTWKKRLLVMRSDASVRLHSMRIGLHRAVAISKRELRRHRWVQVFMAACFGWLYGHFMTTLLFVPFVMWVGPTMPASLLLLVLVGWLIFIVVSVMKLVDMFLEWLYDL